MADDKKRRFARFYYDDFVRDYPAVYDDDAALATWLRLLVVAEKAWPATPELPRSAKPRPVRILVEHGLVALGPNYEFSIKGLDEERTKRSEVASQNATLRWNRPKVEGGKPASRRTRFKVLERDGYRCRYCGRTSDEVALDVDHIKPVREGGTDDLDNLVAACVDCNTGKSGHPARAPHNSDARALLEQGTEQEENEVTPPPPVGKRANGTNARQTGDNPRANGTSPRQERAKEKRGGGMTLHAILEAARKGETA